MISLRDNTQDMFRERVSLHFKKQITSLDMRLTHTGEIALRSIPASRLGRKSTITARGVCIYISSPTQFL